MSDHSQRSHYPKLEAVNISEQTPKKIRLTPFIYSIIHTKVTGLTIQEIFMTGRKPIFTVALICSKFFAPARILSVMKDDIWGKGDGPMTAIEAR